MSKTVLDLNALYTKFNRNPNDIDNINRINRFRIRNPNDELTRTTAYVFFVRPDLNLMSDADVLNRQAYNCPEFVQAHADYRAILYCLSRINQGVKCRIDSPFINMITSYASGFAPQDAVIDIEEVGETFVGYKMNYGKFTADSMNGGEISIKYRDNRYLEIYKLHHLWYSYIMYIRRGKLKPRDRYLEEKILDYQTCAYYFVVGEDGETIIYAAKYYGVFPKNLPSSAFGFNEGEQGNTVVEYDITYNWTFRDDYNYLHIFHDFNAIAGQSNIGSSKIVGAFNHRDYIPTSTWVKSAKIITSIRDGAYKLRFFSG